MTRVDKAGITVTETWWTILVPPAWFAGFDDALAGRFAAVGAHQLGMGPRLRLVILEVVVGTDQRLPDPVQVRPAVGHSRHVEAGPRSWNRHLRPGLRLHRGRRHDHPEEESHRRYAGHNE